MLLRYSYIVNLKDIIALIEIVCVCVFFCVCVCARVWLRVVLLSFSDIVVILKSTHSSFPVYSKFALSFLSLTLNVCWLFLINVYFCFFHIKVNVFCPFHIFYMNSTLASCFFFHRENSYWFLLYTIFQICFFVVVFGRCFYIV